MRLWIRDFACGSYDQSLDIATGTLIGRFECQGTIIRTRSWIDAVVNQLIVEVFVEQTGRPHPVVGFHARAFAKQTDPNNGGAILPTYAGVDGDVVFAERETWDRGRWVCRATMAMRVHGATTRAWSVGNSVANLGFTLAAGQRATITLDVAGGRDSTDHRAAAIAAASRTTPDTLTARRASHEAWWQRYWERAWIDVGGGIAERFWYGSHYVLACCTRPGCVAPGIFGFSTDDHPRWSGDYHLNYNFEHPFASLCVANRLDWLEPYETAISQFIGSGRVRAASDLKPACNGVYYPIGLAPWGIAAQDDYMGQKCAAAYAAWHFTEHFYHTLDPALTRSKLYPYVREVALFWSSYLTREADRWVIRGSASHEHGGHNVNTAFDLPLVRRVLQAAIDMSTLLEFDADLRRTWRQQLAALAAYPTGMHEGKRVLVESEDAEHFTQSISLFNVIWPGAGDVGVGGNTELLQTCRNTIAALDLWEQGNSFSWVYPAAVRVGLPGTLDRLEAHLAGPRGLRPNLTVAQPYGGIETCGAAAAINEMLLQSHDGVIRVFPAWPIDRAASFVNLRARGAFLVSASLENGAVRSITLHSEAGRPIVLINPWPADRACSVATDGHSQTIDLDSQPITLPTRRGQTVLISRLSAGR
jgi:hypothetical protein